MFQSPIGTQKTKPYLYNAVLDLAFQSPIGTQKTRASPFFNHR